MLEVAALITATYQTNGAHQLDGNVKLRNIVHYLSGAGRAGGGGSAPNARHTLREGPCLTMRYFRGSLKRRSL